jgi:hypothetical protein
MENLDMKTCTKCKVRKEETEFRRSASACKSCDKLYQREPRPHLLVMYNNMRANSHSRGRDRPNFTREEFIEWAYKHKYEYWYDIWKTTGFAHLETPSIDRLDIKVTYKFSNMEIVPWKENKRRYISSVSSGVVQYTTDGKLVKTHPSIRAAMRHLGKTGSGKSIKRVLDDHKKSAYGYLWKSISKNKQ